MTDSTPAENPFEPPLSTSENPFAGSPEGTRSNQKNPEQEKFNQLGRLFIAWEKLRVIYNIALAVLAIPIAILIVLQAASKGQTIESLSMTCLFGAIGANLCFTAGFYINARLAILGIKGRIVTIALFWAGVGISIPLVVLALAGAAHW